MVETKQSKKLIECQNYNKVSSHQVVYNQNHGKEKNVLSNKSQVCVHVSISIHEGTSICQELHLFQCFKYMQGGYIVDIFGFR